MLRRLRTWTMATAAMFAFAVAHGQTSPVPQDITTDQKQAVLKDMDQIITHQAYVPGVDFSKWPNLVKEHEKEVDDAKTDADFTNVMNEALHEFGFSHIVLFSPQAADARNTRKMAGLGVRVQIEKEGLRIVFVFPNAPADQAGIRPGDLIVAADGKPVHTTADLAGDENTRVKVTVDRDGKKNVYDITRKIFSTDMPETIKWVESDTALVTIPTFDLGYRKSRVSEIMNEAMKAKNLILDLRSNGGGQVSNLLHLASYFIDTKTAFGTFVNRTMADKYAEETGKPGTDPLAVANWVPDKDRLRTLDPRSELYTGKIVVLINGGTGSASEMMAAALHEYRDARLIGSKSAGAVLASFMRPIAEKFLLQYPVMDYVTGKGVRLEGHGLVPDEEAPIAKFGEDDKAITLAVKWFTTGQFAHLF